MFNKKNILIIILLIFFSVPSIYSLFHSGFFVTDDGEWMVIRFSAFYQALADGQFPVRFLTRLNNGFGYPVANFLYPGFMYLGTPIHYLGFGFVSTIKIIFGLSMVFSAVFSYLWLSQLFNKYSAFIGSLFYLYTPYHLYDLYKRGSIGEVLALAIVPFILWQIERKSLFFLSIGIAFLILSHNTLALLFLPLIIIYKLISDYSHGENKKNLILNTLYSILFGLGLSAFFWIPAIFELSYTKFSQTQISDFRSYFADINLIGSSSIIILILSVLFFYKVRPLKRSHLHERLFIFFLIITILTIFFSSQLSSLFWNFLPSSFIQFPFRLLSYLILSISFLSAYIIYSSSERSESRSTNNETMKQFNNVCSARTIIISIILLAVLFFSSFQFLKPPEFFEKTEGLYATNEGTTTVMDEYMPKWVAEKPIEHFKEKVEIINRQNEISNLSYNSRNISFDINSQADSKVRINTIYYPGWKADVDGIPSNIQYNNPQGIMGLSIPKGNHNVNLSFSETPLRLFTDILSLISFIFIIFCNKILFIKYKR